MKEIQGWTPGALSRSHWRGLRWTSSKFTSVLSAASPLKILLRSKSTFLSTSLTAHLTSVKSAACATPPTAHWPDTSLLSTGWRSLKALADITDGARKMRRVKERTSSMLLMRTAMGHQTLNVRCVGRCLKRRETWTLTWGHTGWHS